MFRETVFPGNWLPESLKHATQSTRCLSVSLCFCRCPNACFWISVSAQVILTETSVLVVEPASLQLHSGLHFPGFISGWMCTYLYRVSVYTHLYVEFPCFPISQVFTRSLRSFRRFEYPLSVPIQRQQLSSVPYHMHPAQSSYWVYIGSKNSIQSNWTPPSAIGCWIS